MNEPPKNIWKKPLKGFRGFAISLLLVFAAALVAGTLVAVLVPRGSLAEVVDVAFAVTAGYVAAIGLGCGVYQAIRWLCCLRNLARLLFGLACLATLIGLAYAEEDLRGWLAWSHFKHQWQAKGVRFDRAALIPAAVPDDRNFALTPIVASSYASVLDKNGRELNTRNTNVVNRLSINPGTEYYDWPTNGNWAMGTVTDLRGWQEYYRTLMDPNHWRKVYPGEKPETNLFAVPPQPQSPAADVLLALGKYNATIEELRDAAKLPDSRFPLTYDKDNPAMILLPHLAALRRCSLVLQLRAIAELQNGQSSQALADVKLMLRLADAVRSEPFIISQLVRIAIVRLALQPIYEGLAEHKWTDPQLAELDSELATLDFLADYKLAIRNDLAFEGGLYDFLRRHPEQVQNLPNGIPNSPPLLTRILLCSIPRGWFYQNQLHQARIVLQYYLPIADPSQRTVSPSSGRAAENAFGAEFKHLGPGNFIEHTLFLDFIKSIQRFAYCQESVDLARVGTALERYRLAVGQYPDSLDALAPRFIQAVPRDIIGGQPLHYRLTGDGNFILYSVGWNERDDAGKVVQGGYPETGGTVNINEGDWVWRYPSM